MKLSFTDFWGDFNKNKNFFYFLFSQFDTVEITEPEDADILIYSVFGQEHRKFEKKKRIFYTGENIRPNYDNCDFAFSFDFDENQKNIRLPLWMLQIDWFNQVNYDNPKYTIPYEEIDDNKFIRKEKNQFCSTVFNNVSPYRLEMVRELNKYKPVHCYGRPFGNWFYGEDQKYEIISNYKFNICFENSIHPGYYTEKPIHAKTAGCIPIYWSDRHMSVDFNKNAFVNLFSFNNKVSDLVEYIIEIDKSETMYQEVFNQKLFLPEQDPKIIFNKISEKIKNIL